MRESLRNLIELQEIDRRLDDLERAKGDLPRIVQELQSRLEEQNELLAQKTEELEAVQKERRHAEREIASLTEAKKKYEEQLYSVTTNKEYDAVTLEIETAAQKIDELETAVLQLIDREEALAKERQELEEAIAALQKELEAQSKVLNEKIEANARVEAELRSAREGLVSKIRVDFLRRYERIRSHKDGLAVVPIVRNSCGGCYTQIPPQKSMEVRDGDKLVSCESCGRILYWQEESESVDVS